MTEHPAISQAQALRVIRKQGLARPRDLAQHGIYRVQLARLVDAGVVERIARGVYVAADHEISADLAAAIVATRVPSAVISLLTVRRRSPSWAP